MGITHHLENIWIATIVSYLIILIIYLINKSTWIYIFAILLAYLIADVIVNFFIRGGGGIVQIPFLRSNRTQHKGHGYLVFVLAIVISTIISGYFSDFASGWINNLTGWSALILPNLVVIILLYVDFLLTFYSR